MKALKSLAIFSGISFVIWSSACATSAHEVQGRLPMPEEWAPQIPEINSNNCAKINAIFENIGLGTFGQEPGLREARLDAALGRVAPASKKPGRIAISSENDDTLLIRYLDNKEQYSFSVSVTCEDQWLTWKESSEKHYLADGVTLRESHDKFRLRQGIDSSLIVHSRGESVYSTSSIFRDRETTEWWSKFPLTKVE